MAGAVGGVSHGEGLGADDSEDKETKIEVNELQSVLAGENVSRSKGTGKGEGRVMRSEAS